MAASQVSQVSPTADVVAGRAASKLDTFRARSRMSGPSHTAHLTTNQINFVSISGAPDALPEGGGRFTPTVTLEANPIGPIEDLTDPDACEIGVLQNGFGVRLKMLIDGVEEAEIARCHRADAQEEYNFEVMLTDPGSHTIEFVIEGRSSGDVADSRELSVVVEEGREEERDRGGVENGGSNGNDSQSLGGFFGQIAGAGQNALLLLGVVVLLFVAVSFTT